MTDPKASFLNDRANRVAGLRDVAAKLESYIREVEAEPYNAPMHVWLAIQWSELELHMAMQRSFDWMTDRDGENWRITLCQELSINPSTGYPIRDDGEDMDGSEPSFDNRYFVKEWM